MELLLSNPIKKVQLPKDQKKEMTVWKIDEIEAFLKISDKDRLYTAFYLAIATGMRRGGILGPRWKDVDLDKGMLSVRQTLSKDGKQFLNGAKTDSSIRSITLPEETIAILRKQKARTAREKLQSGPEYINYDLVV
jgi:integrase